MLFTVKVKPMDDSSSVGRDKSIKPGLVEKHQALAVEANKILRWTCEPVSVIILSWVTLRD